jgi:N-acetylglucosaminyldiphosphoundecaprenol N-acetyl-beta-D-mannosaminyltransferase
MGSEVPGYTSLGIGASFDFAASVLRRASSWMQHIGLEWFWRFLMEPRRLWSSVPSHSLLVRWQK